MKTVKALVAFSNGVISMEQYEVRELPTEMANDLIAAGICAEVGGGSGGGVLVANATQEGTTLTLDKTWQEIHDAMLSGGAVVSYPGSSIVGSVLASFNDYKAGECLITAYSPLDMLIVSFSASSVDGYPAIGEK